MTRRILNRAFIKAMVPVRYEPTKCRTGRKPPKIATKGMAERIQAGYTRRLMDKPQATAVAELKRWRKNDKRLLNKDRGAYL